MKGIIRAAFAKVQGKTPKRPTPIPSVPPYAGGKTPKKPTPVPGVTIGKTPKRPTPIPSIPRR